MEKQNKPKNKFLKFLPRAASAITFQNPPNFSPTKDKRSDNNNLHKTHIGKGFSGPLVSIVPVEARRKPKNTGFISQEEYEPTSPKVSCMGQIKLKKNKKKSQKIKKEKVVNVSLPRDFKGVNDNASKPSKIGKMFGGTTKPSGRKSDASADDHHRGGVPRLNQIKRFSSGRDTLAGFDWRAQVAPVVDGDHDLDYFSGEESEEDREIIIPFSAPILVGGGGDSGGVGGGGGLEPRKEINIWQRRTMAQPRPLQVK